MKAIPVVVEALLSQTIALPAQSDLFFNPEQIPDRAMWPVLVAWGGGVDSTAMLIELIARGERVDAILFADTGGEKTETYQFILKMIKYFRARGKVVHIVRAVTSRFKNWPRYDTLETNCLTNGTLPSLAFNFKRKSCSHKWKVAPQNKWTALWQPARDIWAAGGKVIKLIGYDCSPADMKRYAHIEGHLDPRMEYRYPLREWGWTREDCIRRIVAEGLPVPPKSACFFCPSMKPEEVRQLAKEYLRRIVVMEARAKPRLTSINGLWAKKASMTHFIREERLLPHEEIDRLIAMVPEEKLLRRDVEAGTEAALAQFPKWEAFLAELRSAEFQAPSTAPLYSEVDIAEDWDLEVRA